MLIKEHLTPIDKTIVEGVFSPYFGSQLTINNVLLTLVTDNSTLKRVNLTFTSTPTPDKNLTTGKFILESLVDGVWSQEDLLLDIGLNHTRNLSNFREDHVRWMATKDLSTLTFTIWYYNDQATKVFNVPAQISHITYDQSNAKHYLTNSVFPKNNRLKRFDGSSWVPYPLKYFDGVDWVEKPLKYFDGEWKV